MQTVAAKKHTAGDIVSVSQFTDGSITGNWIFEEEPRTKRHMGLDRDILRADVG